MDKAIPHRDYPPEEGRYVRGIDSSPVAVVIILNTRPEDIPVELEALVQAGVKGGAALSGTVQTENIGIEKIVCNIVSNPNIRYLILGGPESEGHLTGDALKKFIVKGVDGNRHIKGTRAPNPKLLNLPAEYIERFRKQVTLIDLQFQGDPDLLELTVRACQEGGTVHDTYRLADPGPYPKAPLSGRIVWRVKQPWAEPADDEERAAVKRAKELMEKLRKKHRANSR
jgi:tetrahydromethanopterin S-methyltransferase subunit A